MARTSVRHHPRSGRAVGAAAARPTSLLVARLAEVGSLVATATDPATSAVVDEISIPVLGTAVP